MNAPQTDPEPEPRYPLGAAYWGAGDYAGTGILFRVEEGWAYTPGGQVQVVDRRDRLSLGERAMVATWPNDEARAAFLSTFTPGKPWGTACNVWLQSIADAIRSQGGGE